MDTADFKNRLRNIVGEGRKVSAFAKKCGFTEGVLRRYLAGESLPGLDKLVKIAMVGEVSLDWLAMGLKEDAAPAVSEQDTDYAVNNDLREALQRILNEGDPAKVPVLRSMLAALDPGKK